MRIPGTVRAFLCAVPCLLAACTPSYNWREVRLDGQVRAMLPCQPDVAQRPIDLLGRRVEVEMTGCEAGTGMFVLARVQLDDPEQTRAAADHWKAAVRRHLGASLDSGEPEATRESAAQPAALQRLMAAGRRADGQPVRVQAVWVARDAVLYHGAIYYDELPQDVLDMFFSGLATP